MSTNLRGESLGMPPVIPRDRIYRNDGNAAVVAMLDDDVLEVLDVGCGAGDNALLIRSRLPGCHVHGITHSEAERAVAIERMATCRVLDIEGEIPSELAAVKFDAIIFSHVLEHLRHPEWVLHNFTGLLKPGGKIIIAVPNVLSWNMRLRFLRGDFEYQSEGVLDDTHLRFFTYRTADRYLLQKSPALTLVSKGVTGSVPQWWLRRYLLPKRCCEWVDRLGCRFWPNLFGGEILLKAVYRGAGRPG